MKKLVTLLVLLFTTIGFSQTLTTPTSQEVPVGVNGVGISGFSLSGYNSTTTYKVSLSITGSANATFSVGTTTGLTRDYGYSSWSDITSVNFTGTPTNIQNGLNSIKFNTSSTVDGLINLSVVISTQLSNTYYNPTNGHMYKFVSGNVSYASAKTSAANSTFQGESGYLVTITSADEQSFVQSKVYGNNIWIALSDEGREGVWKIDAGPENGTTVWTTNNLSLVATNRTSSYHYGGTTATGQYSKWSSGEPNNAYGSYGEDHAVMKWSGGTGWNDLYKSYPWGIGGYVIEYGTWTDPTQSTFNSTQQTQITFTQKNIPYLTYQFNFNNNVDITNWGGRMYYRNTPSQLLTDRTEDIPLSSNGFVNPTSQIYPQTTDGTKKATTVGGQVEWCVVYDYDSTNKRYRVGIDIREYPAGFMFVWLKKLQLFDLWNGDVTFKSNDSSWAEYWIYTDTEFDFSNSSYSSYIRDANGFYGMKAEFSFEDNTSLPEQYFVFKNFSRTEVQQMIDDMVTVSDVVLAFNELAGGGINGGLKGDLGGIQLALGDVDKNGQFNFQDTYKMLEHLQGTKALYSSQNLANILIARQKSEYEGYTTQDWSNGIHAKTSVETNMTDTDLVQQLEYNIGFKGDVNLSHSMSSSDVSVNVSAKAPRTVSFSKDNGINESTAYIETEIVDGKILATVELTSTNLAGAQFKLNYSGKIKYGGIEYSSSATNFVSDKGSYISIGTLSTEQKALENTVKYIIEFTPTQEIKSALGLITLEVIDAIDIDNNLVGIKII